MSEKFRNRYRIKSARFAGWDYGRNGAYFLTICTQDRIHFFGSIDRGQMTLSDAGKVAFEIWKYIPIQFPYIYLDAFVIMPDHMHGILIIQKDFNHHGPCITADSKNDETGKPGGITGAHNPMLHENISRVIRWYKGRVKFETRKSMPDFEWHPRFHDHIIRSLPEHDRIRRYIENNPLRWP